MQISHNAHALRNDVMFIFVEGVGAGVDVFNVFKESILHCVVAENSVPKVENFA